MPSYINLMAGDPAPVFSQRSISNSIYAIDTAAGRYLVLCFLASGGDVLGQAAITAMRTRPDLFDDIKASFFAVSFDRHDESESRIKDSYPGYRTIWDFDGTAGKLYGALPVDSHADQTRLQVRRIWVVTDPTLRVLKVFPFAADGGDAGQVIDFLAKLPPPARFAGFEIQAPVLVLPNVFEPEFCVKLIGLYEAHGGTESGFMREVGGKTVAVHDPGHKRRRDCSIDDQAVIKDTQARINRRVVPQIIKAHQFTVTRMERYIVSCYAAEDSAHFQPHRDNTTKGTAHRCFAVSVNLNDEFDGGEISFPEYGPRSFKVAAGGAVVFSCSLLHAVSRVTRGRRFAFLPFLYDDAAAKIREANNSYLGEGVDTYKPAT